MITELCPFVYSIENTLDDYTCDELISLYDLPEIQEFIIKKTDLSPNKKNSNLLTPDTDLIKDYADIEISNLVAENSTDIKIHGKLKILDDALFKSLSEGLTILSDFLEDKSIIMSKIVKRVKGLDNSSVNHNPVIPLNETNGRFEHHFFSDLGYQIQKCGKEYKGFVLHDDFYPERTLVYQWFLNDDFEGGETVFTYPGYHVKPKKGSLMFFPACWTHSHIGLAPKNDYKYIVTGWMRYKSQAFK